MDCWYFIVKISQWGANIRPSLLVIELFVGTISYNNHLFCKVNPASAWTFYIQHLCKFSTLSFKMTRANGKRASVPSTAPWNCYKKSRVTPKRPDPCSLCIIMEMWTNFGRFLCLLITGYCYKIPELCTGLGWAGLGWARAHFPPLVTTPRHSGLHVCTISGATFDVFGCFHLDPLSLDLSWAYSFILVLSISVYLIFKTI